MKIRAHRLSGNVKAAPGDYIKVKGNDRLVPVTMIIGYFVKDIEKAAGSELEGIYRPVEEVKS
jgi:hypothetical protein